MIKISKDRLRWLCESGSVGGGALSYFTRHPGRPDEMRDNTTGQVYRITNDNGREVTLKPIIGKHTRTIQGQGDAFKAGNINYGTQNQDQTTLF